MISLLGDRVIWSNNGLLVKNKEDLLSVMGVLKDNSLMQFKVIVDITGVDLGHGSILLKYMLLSVRHSSRVVVTCIVNDEVDSIRNLYEGSVWLEREVFDMFGITFKNHGDLRKILTDYGFKGNPLLKSFRSVEDVRYSEDSKSVINRR